jgi:hypothetical protein
MDNSGKFIKEHWEKGALVVCAAFESVVAFERHFAEISLAARFFLSGLSGAIAIWSVAEMLRRKREHAIGFETGTKEEEISVGWISVRGLAILVVCAFSVYLFAQTATFHNLRVLQRTDTTNHSVGTIEIRPPHSPANVTLVVWTPQPDVKILQEAPASWNEDDAVDWRMQNETPFGVTLILEDFKSPQVFGIWYRLSGRAEELRVEISVKPAEVRVLRAGELRSYRRLTWIFGGCLCAFGLLYWSHRSSWFQGAT